MQVVVMAQKCRHQQVRRPHLGQSLELAEGRRKIKGKKEAEKV
jgi:hypothetical protein